MAHALVSVEILAFGVAAAFGVMWYLYPTENWEPPFGLATLVLVLVEIIRRLARPSKLDPNTLAGFIEEGQVLRNRLAEDPLPIADHNAWVDRIEKYLIENNYRYLSVRLSDFSGMTFYGDASEKSQMSKSIDGRTRRLHEFVQEHSRGS